MHAAGIKKESLSTLSSRKVTDCKSFRVGIIYTQWNEEIIHTLLHGAVTEFVKQGVPKDNILEIQVPGAYELPYAASRLISSQAVDAVIVLGCLIKGETMHFEYICEAVTQGIMRLNLDTGVPVLFGVLACLTEKQARARAGLEEGGHNHGVEWAQSALQMAHVKRTTQRCPLRGVHRCGKGGQGCPLRISCGVIGTVLAVGIGAAVYGLKAGWKK